LYNYKKPFSKISKNVFTAALTILLILSSITLVVSPFLASPKTEEHNKTLYKALYVPTTNFNKQPNIRFVNVTLITGDTVLAMVAENGTVLSVSIHPSDPHKLGQNFLVLKMRNSTYVIPSGIDLNIFDIELFNIDLLIREGYAELPHIPVIIQGYDVATVNKLATQLTANELKVTKKFSIIPALVVKIPKDKVVELPKGIRRIWLDRKIYSNLYESTPLIGAPYAWNIGINGSGVRIAILDTGIDSSHPDFYFPNGTSKIELAVSFVDHDFDGIPDEPPDDYFGHGTHVASIAAGGGWKSIIMPTILEIRTAISRPHDDNFARIATNGTHIAMVWQSYYNGNWDIWFSIYDGHYWTPPQQLTNNEDLDLYPFITFLKDGRILVLWTSNRTANYQIWYKVYDKGMWSPDKQLTVGPAWHSYSPVIQLSNGSIAITYSSNTTSNIDVWFAILNLDDSNTLNWVSNRQLTSANSTMWLFSSSIIQSPNGEIWVFIYDPYNFNFTTNIGGITHIYYNVSTDMGATWLGGLLTSGSGFVNPSAVALPDGTMMLVFEGDDLDRNIPYTIWYMVYHNNTWSQPKILTPGRYLALPSIAYVANLGRIYIVAQNWINDELHNDIFLLSIPIFRGVAYGATLWNVKVLSKYGWGYTSWIIAGIEFAALGPDEEPNTGDEADILSMSLGAPWWSDGTDPLSLACDKAVELGRVVVVAAGNWGPDYFTIGTPAAARKVVTVGASDKYDLLAWFSSRGPTVDFRVKPDVVAPGVKIWAALARGSYIEYSANQSRIPAIDVDGDGRYDYVMLSGTSMATPHVSGVAALLKQLNPDLTPEEVKNILISTAKDLGYNVYEQGGGRVDVEAAINTPILVDPATISLGLITENTLINTTIMFTFKPLTTTIPSDVTNITIALEAVVKDIITGNIVNAATLNATTITIPLNESRAVQLTINTSIPKSIYEGKVIAKVIGGPWENRTVHATLGFAKLNNVTIKMIDRNGYPAIYKPITIFEHNPTSYYWGLNIVFNTYTDENGEVHVYLPDGEFYIIGLDWDYNTQADIWTIADRVPIYENTIIVLDERDAKEVNFDPAKPNQVFAAKRVSINYHAAGYSLQLTTLWYYPSTALTYMTNTTLGVSFSYEYYDMNYFNVVDPSVIDAPEWHNLIYWQSGITPPVTYVADYNNLVKRVTEYRVPMTPKLAALFIQHKLLDEYYFSEGFAWFMNVPRSRVEWLTPGIPYWTFYEKYKDPPWIYTPDWFYAYWPFIKEIYPPGEVREVFGGHPLSTHFLVLAGYNWLYMVSDLHMDTYGHTLQKDYGYVRIYRNDSLIVDSYIWDYFWYGWYGDPRPARYRVEIEGWSGLWISGYTYTVLEFMVVNETTYYAPPSLYIDVPCLTLNNTCPAGEVTVNVYVNDPRVSSEANVTLLFSTNDGGTWQNATLVKHNPGEPYVFSLGKLSNAYVSLWINAKNDVNTNILMMVIRGFYVLPSVPTPDLTIASIDYTPKPVTAGQPVNISVIVSNIGGADAETFKVSVFVNDSEVAVKGVEWLRANESIELVFEWTPPTPGTYIIKAIADSDNEIVESDEANNEAKITIEVSAPPPVTPLYMFVTGLGNDVWYREFDGENWGPWKPLGGIALDGPSATYYNGKLYVAVRGMNNSIWYGYIDIASGNFSGWISVPGLTPSRPTLVSTSNGVLMLVRGLGDDIWVYPLTWPNASWINIPGLTIDSPVAVGVGSKVHIVVRGLDGYSLWFGVLDINTWSFTGWNSIAGLTDSTPDLVVDKSTRVVYLAVKGIEGGVFINIYTKSLGWYGWINIPGGVTDKGPAIEILNNKLIVVVKDLGQGIWINMKQPDGSWIDWTPIDGLTQHQPELLTTN